MTIIVHLMSLFGMEHLQTMIGLKKINVVEDVENSIPVKFR